MGVRPPAGSVGAMSSRSQNQALSAAEAALEALGRKDPVSARAAVSTAVERDETGTFSSFADAVYLAASEMEENGDISESAWNQLADAIGPGPLQGIVEQIR